MFGGGAAPGEPLIPHIPIQNSDANQYSIAQQLFNQGYGDQNAFPNGFPSYDDYKSNDETRIQVGEYLGRDIRADLTEANTSYTETLPHTPPKVGE